MRPLLLVLLPWLFFASLLCNGPPWAGPGPAWGAEEWRLEFNALCAGTQEAVALSSAELQDLVGRCNALHKVIEHLGQERPTESKVYLKRLDMCRGLYEYVLRTKENK